MRRPIRRFWTLYAGTIFLYGNNGGRDNYPLLRGDL